KSHTEFGACRTVAGEESTGAEIVPQVFGAVGATGALRLVLIIDETSLSGKMLSVSLLAMAHAYWRTSTI
ncbi:MAG TPA: hypothetical protein VLT51_11570, partial [Anaerolineales bacterium]|nr:hypothetical protein [Anaerolineales bacterium]